MESKKKILMIIAKEKFRDEEYLIPKKIFLENNFNVVTASKEKGICYGMINAKVNADISVYDIKFIEDYVGICFVGGIGALDYEKDSKIHALIKDAIKKNIVLGAICISPRILGEVGVLEKKRYTIFNKNDSQKDYIVKFKGDYTSNSVEVDGLLVTADGPKSAEEFANSVLKKIKNS